MDWLDDGPISGEDLMAEIVEFYPETLDYLAGIGMHCLGCPASRGESIEEACMVHGADADKLVDALNKAVGA